MRKLVLIALCLLALLAGLGVWWFGAAGNRIKPGSMAVAPTAAAAIRPSASTNLATARLHPGFSTNRAAFRLTNTTKTITELTGVRHAILLGNAFIDTDSPLDLKIPAHLRADGNPGAYIVQAKDGLNASFRAMLTAAGAQVVSYIPNNAYLVRLPADGAGKLSADARVQAVLPYEPYYKLQSSLLGLAVELNELPPGTALNLGLFAADAKATELALEKLGAKIISRDRSSFGPILRVLAPADWTPLVQLPGVQAVEVAHQRMTANDLSRVTVGVATDTLVSTNYLGLSGSNVWVAVNDSGIDATHPDLIPRVSGLNPIDLVDTNGHGTHVAGIIGSSGIHSISNNPVDIGTYAQGSVPGADFRGKAPLVNLYSINYGHSDYTLQTNAALNHALISNNSWDYGSTEYDLAAASYDAATRDALPGVTGSQSVLYVFAAGNSGGGDSDGAQGAADTILSPGTAKNVITVGALEQFRNLTNIVTDANSNKSAFWQPRTDSSSQLAEYSSRGNVGIGTEGTYGRFKPDVVAPGTFVVSTRSGQWDTNAYYNPTNAQTTTYTYQIIATNSFLYYSVSVPVNVVAVVVSITANKQSSPFPTNLLIYAVKTGVPGPLNNDIVTAKNGLSIPSDSGGNITDITDIQGTGFSFAVANTNNFSVNYDLAVTLYSTNNVGDRYQVLQAMNEQLAPYYRYESGTSMAAADVSGVLALIQDYFTNTLSLTPSPALLKALLINGSRTVNNYGVAITNGINYQGWGLVNIANSLPLADVTNSVVTGTDVPMFFADQSPANALATGDSHTYLLTLNTNEGADRLTLKTTLVWTDPPGDPIAAIKLVNNLDLVVTNLDNGKVYFGNDIDASSGFSRAWSTNALPTLDTINNVENIVLKPRLGGRYSVTVVGRGVHVNAVTAHTNNVVQDYALVITSGQGEIPDALTVADSGIVVSNPTGDQDITMVITTNSPLYNQFVGASSPLLGTNTMALGSNTVWGADGAVTLGQTNQWHFYVVTNTGTDAEFTNAAFLTFNPYTLSVPRMGVYEDTTANATRTEADIDMYVSQDPTLTNLNPTVIADCLAGVGNSGVSLGQGGTEFVYFTNSSPGQVYYIGIKSEDRMASEYAFLPVFTKEPFSKLDKNGNLVVPGILLPVAIPDGNNAHPGLTNVFALALPLIPNMQVAKVTVTNLNQHQNVGDLFGALSFGGKYSVLNNHNTNAYGFRPIIYDDSRNPVVGTKPSDGPGSLVNFRGRSAIGPWILSEMDDAQTQTGRVSRFSLLIQPHRKLENGITVTIPPGGWFVDYMDVGAGYTNLTFYGTNTDIPPVTPAVQMFEKMGDEPTLTDYDQMAGLTNSPYPTGEYPGNLISVGPPLDMGRYFVGLYNPGTTEATVYLLATLGKDAGVNNVYTYGTNSPVTLPDDAVTKTSLYVPATQRLASVNVGMVVNHPRISDLAFTLISPSGTRVLLMENRGGTGTNIGHFSETVIAAPPTASTGTNMPDINVFRGVPITGILRIAYNFYDAPDTMDVFYDGTNIFSSGLISNPRDATGNIWLTNYIAYSGIDTNITVIMNMHTNSDAGTKWDYALAIVKQDANYLTFTDDSDLAQVPIKYAKSPLDMSSPTTNYSFSDFEQTSTGDYHGLTNILDPSGSWTVPTNQVAVTQLHSLTNGGFYYVTNTVTLTNNLVSVYADPSTAAGGSNYLALGNGALYRTLPFTVGRKYRVAYAYRGPGMAGWWRGEGNATDSADPEERGNNGVLIGRFNYPAGEVNQAYQFEDAGDQFGFAGTNTYIQVPQSTSLDVGKGGGFTIEGWINPTNLGRPQPIAEWLAHVSTNAALTNLVITAGPYLNRATGHYYYMLGATNWMVSEYWATQLGGHLVTLDTANEQNWVFDNFANYGGTNHNLWIGLTNTTANKFVWSSGLTNIVYTNWLSGQPLNCDGNHKCTFMRGASNSPSGLWMLADTNGFVCGSANTNRIYGVVEVDEIQTNGVQFWVSVTNTPGTTNAAFFTSTASTNGCLYANIVDTNFVAHEFWSAPGLIASNVYQHIALTFNTNSGLATLYLNGTNVAATNLFMASGVYTPFVPKTDGDFLLGRDMSRSTNNFYGGKMDEMSLYGRALTPAEITAIYNISALTTNRLAGKFDPAVTPAFGLAEAMVTLGTQTNWVRGVNRQWNTGSFSFTAETNSLQLGIIGLQPGLLMDSFAIAEYALEQLYYFPEQPLSVLQGESAQGNWQLEVWDNRAGAYLTNLAQVVNWQLTFVLQSNSVIATTLAPQTPTASTVPPGRTVYYAVNVPAWANYATNLLISSDLPVDLLFNPTNVPDGTVAGDQTLLTASSGGIPGGVSAALKVNQPLPFAALEAGRTYYLGVRNNNIHAASIVLEVDYDITALANGVPLTNSFIATNDVRYFSFDVSTNAYEVTFQLLNLTGNADLVVSKGAPLPTLTKAAYGSYNTANSDETIYVLTNSMPEPLTAGRWYLGVFKRDSGVAMDYTVLAKELDMTATAPAIVDLTNGVPVAFTSGSGTALTNFFRFSVTNNPALTNAAGIRFEVYNLDGDGDLTVQTNVLPLAAPFFQASRNAGRNAEMVYTFTNSALTNLAMDWYLGVPNNEPRLIHYTVLAVIQTNNYFPAFPGAAGAGGGAWGGRGGSLYHVTTTNNAGPGSLRDAVGSSNRTVVFDVSGTIILASPLVITNSYLTIAGQTAPGGGITVAGEMTTVQSAHDVVVRNVRFRTGGVGANWSNGFEASVGSGVNTVYAGDYFSGGWLVTSGNIDLINRSDDAYAGNNYIDLNGNFSPGTIATNVPTLAGKSYTLSFAYSQNPDGRLSGYPTAIMGLLQNGSEVLKLTLNVTNNSWTSLGWSTTSVVFTATASTTQLKFEAQNTGGYGVLLDAISLTVNNSSDSLRIANANNVIADHISASWCANNLVSALNSTNVTVQWSIMADSLYITNNPPPLGSQLRYGSGSLSFHHNLYADNYSGNPRLGDNLSLDFVNNVIYNWGLFSGLSQTNDLADNPGGYTNQLNYVCNYLIAGPDTATFGTNYAITNIAYWSGSTNTWIFQTNNFIDSNTNRILDGGNTKWAMFTNAYTMFERPFPLPSVPTDEAYMAYEKVLDFAGPHLGLRDLVDANIVAKVRNQTGRFVTNLVTSGMVAWWKGENNTLDSVGTNHGTLMGATSYVPAEVGQGFQFLNHDDYIDVQPSDSLNVGVSDGFTLECWVKPSDINLINQPLFDWTRVYGLDGVHLFISVYSPGTIYANIFGTDGRSHIAVSSAGIVQQGAFQHIAASYDKLTGICKLYYNGSLVYSSSLGSFTPQTTYGLTLGTRLPNSEHFVGVMDEATIYNRALSDAEIASIYNAGSKGKNAQAATMKPYLDTDQDGMPDFWEQTFATNWNVASNNQDRDGDGYTDLEEYNNWLAAPHALTVTTNPVAVNLMEICGQTGNLSFSVTNGVNGTVYLTNVLNGVTNTSFFSNTIAIFTPTNIPVNFGGYASFDLYVTNNDTIAYFGPVTVSVVASAVPLLSDTNFPPLIITLTNAMPYTNSNFAGSDYYKYTVTNNASGSNAVAALFEVLNPSTNVTLVARYGLPLPSLSSYDYISANPGLADEQIVVSSNSVPLALTNGDWYLAVVNVSGGPVTYTVKATTLYGVTPPTFIYPTNNTYFTNWETVPFTVTCTAIDTNIPVLPLTFTLLNGPTNMTIDPSSGKIDWTPTEAQGPSTNLIEVSVGNGAYFITNSFTIVVWESNLPPVFVLSSIPNQLVPVGNLWVFTNAATDADLPANALTYTLLTAPPTGAMINPTNGVITWLPGLADAGSNYTFTTVVTDTNPWAVNQQSFSVTNSFNVSVTILPSLTNHVAWTNTVPGGGIFYYQVSVPTNADLGSNLLLFAQSLPLNLLFNQTNLPTGTGPGDYTLLDNVTSGLGSPILRLSSTPPLVPGQTYYLGVQNTNSAPVTFAVRVDFHLAEPIPPIYISTIVHTNIGGTDGFLLTWFAPTNFYFQVQWETNLPPVSWQTFTNIVGYDLFISPTNSRFTFFDDGSQTGGFTPTRFYRLITLIRNTLTLPAQSNFVVNASTAITITNSAFDSDPAALLTYSLVNPPAGASISPDGIITWTALPAGLAARFTTVVSDNGTMPAFATNSFTVFVAPFPAISNVVVTATDVTLQWVAPTADRFQVQWTTNLAPAVWYTYPGVITSATGAFSFTDTNAPLVMKFYELILLP